MGPSDFRRGVAACAGSPRLLDFSFPTRCLQSPRGARRLRSSVASPTMAGFVLSGRLATPTLCNEAESSSIALRLAGSPRRASPWGLLLSTPGWLHVGHLFDMLITFQINREASLGLAHRNTQNFTKGTGFDAVLVSPFWRSHKIPPLVSYFVLFRDFRGSFFGIRAQRKSACSSWVWRHGRMKGLL